ncbi:MAG: epoxyqueuosine reductase QueH [Eggerthellaceae bacterium]|nr:epoxyqueuosine reductase QueH [Eggerthellaceae bacterium]
MKLLLHACCGPCSLEPARLLQAAKHELTLAYMNSNIHPAGEYVLRRDTLLNWANAEEIAVVEGSYDAEAWEVAVAPALALPEGERSERCRLCYRMRFEEVARFAAQQGFDAISTTLTVSPYQFPEVIAEELQRAGDRFGLSVLFEDFRLFYPEATRRSRELGMYRQNYCGCRFSQAEAQTQREQRKSGQRGGGQGDGKQEAGKQRGDEQEEAAR